MIDRIKNRNLNLGLITLTKPEMKHYTPTKAKFTTQNS